MIYLRFEIEGKKKDGVLENKTVYEITPNFYSKYKKTGKKFDISKVKILIPCEPSKIIALGLNYMSHASELKMALPKEPLIFLKAPTSAIGPGETIIYPDISQRVDYEAELAIVIKKKGKNIPLKEAQDHILGYTCLNDVTARDLQKIDGQWTRAKSFDTFSPIGPWIVDNIDPHNLKIEALVNGKVLQDSNTKDMIFKVNEVVSFVSRIMTLLPGDVISTGTPPGVGPLVRGDKVKIKIQKIGELANSVA
ncbi:MAG: fumarylacetoacetate hydrolase family protein [Elusimicrobia bacterium]|nr:fumarylacetoacetate hydrolase family protein [Elusimicrobiota bacterium]